MPAMLNTILGEAGLPISEVILVRHKDTRKGTTRRIYDLWLNDREKFELYQSIQKDLPIFKKPYWAVFVVDDDQEVMFAGLYISRYKGLLKRNVRAPQADGVIWKAGKYDEYDQQLSDTLKDYIGELFIEWRDGAPSWKQYAAGHDKRVVRLPGANTGGNRRAKDTLTQDPFALERPKIESTTKEALINARNGQGTFRQRVLQIWDHRCAVTRSTTLGAIRASHIKPWSKSTDEERLDSENGLPLLATLDALFDFKKGLISFDSSGRLLISTRLNMNERRILGINRRSLAKKPSRRTAEYLPYHREHVFVD
jgi:hypothetical protein